MLIIYQSLVSLTINISDYAVFYVLIYVFIYLRCSEGMFSTRGRSMSLLISPVHTVL
jgi:hypothetical protein